VVGESKEKMGVQRKPQGGRRYSTSRKIAGETGEKGFIVPAWGKKKTEKKDVTTTLGQRESQGGRRVE